MSVYAAGTLTATVIDVGWEHCTISPVFEQTGIMHHAVTRSDVGLRHVAIYLSYLLSKDESVVQALIALDARRNAESEAGHDGSGEQLAVRLFELAVHLIGQGKVKATLQGEGYANKVAREDEEEAEFDIAAALVAGREKAAIAEQERRNRAALEASNREAAQDTATTGQGLGAVQGDGNRGEAQTGASREEGAETVEFEDITLTVGPGPLSQACEPLWDPSVLSILRGTLAASAVSSLGSLDLGSASVTGDFSTFRSLPESIASSIAAASEPERRAQLWETLLATGSPVRLLQNFTSVLTAACQATLASTHGADQGSGPTSALAAGSGGLSRDSPGVGGGLEDTSQPTQARCIKTPDYFAEFKDRTDLAPFLGATIYAKLAFTDPYGRLITSKAVYNEKGPSATFLVFAPS